MMTARPITDNKTHAMIRARLLRRLGAPEAPGAASQQRLAAASDDIRNALVPLQTVAELLQSRYDGESNEWCVSMLREEVKHILSILDEISP